MNNKLFHAMNFTKTFIDVESGSFISLPKDETDKPPVNADINNNIDTFHSTGGEGTPSEQIPLVNVSEWNKTVCGKNLFDINTLTDKFNVDTQITDNDIIITATSIGTFRRVQSTNFILPAGTYYLYRDFEIISGTSIGSTGTAILYEAGTSDNIKFNNGSFTLLNTTDVYLALYLSTSVALVDLLSVRFYNIQIERSSSYTGWQKYDGNNYPYRLEDTDGVLHYGGDLPDGTADSVNWETGEFVERKGVKVLDGTEDWSIVTSAMVGTHKFYIALDDAVLSGQTNKVISTHFKSESFDNLYAGRGEPNAVSLWNVSGRLYVRIEDSILGITGADDNATKISKFKTWLGSNNVTVQYKLATPKEPVQIKQYGKTYGGVVWDKNEKPKSIQYHTNIFTDKNITTQCEVRKLGNRKMSEFYWVTENGDKITTEDGDYIMLEY